MTDSLADTLVDAIRDANMDGDRPTAHEIRTDTRHASFHEVTAALAQLRASGRIYKSSGGFVVAEKDVLDELLERDDQLDRTLGLNGYTRDDRRHL